MQTENKIVEGVDHKNALPLFPSGNELARFLSQDFDQFGPTLWQNIVQEWQETLHQTDLPVMIEANLRFIEQADAETYFENTSTEELAEKVSALRQRSLFIISSIVLFRSEREIPQELLSFCSALGDWKDRVSEKVFNAETISQDLRNILTGIPQVEASIATLGSQPVTREAFIAAVHHRVSSITAFLDRLPLPGEDLHTLRKQLRNFFHLAVLLNEHPNLPLNNAFRKMLPSIVTYLRSINKELGAIREEFLIEELEGKELNEEDRYNIPEKTLAKIRTVVAGLTLT